MREGSPPVQPFPARRVGQVIGLLAEASVWAGAHASITRSAADLDPATFLQSVTRGELFGVVANGDVLGCMLLHDQNRIHWPDDGPGEALYLHKRAVRRQQGGLGLGKDPVGFACGGARQRGLAAVCLDTTPMNKLQNYYGRMGFVADPAGPATYAGQWLARMEKRL